MIKQLGTYGLYGLKYACIEYSEFEGIPIYHGLKARRSNNRFNLLSSLSFDREDALFNWLSGQKHCVLVVNTSQVVIKHLPEEVSITEDSVLKAFPSIRLEDFYFEAVAAKKGFFIAICRKTAVNDIIKRLEDNKISVVGISLGFSSLVQLKSIFAEPLQIPSASGVVTIDQNGIEQYDSSSPESSTIKLQADELQSAHVVALSGLSNYVVNNHLSNLAEATSKLQTTFKKLQIFSKGWKLAGGFLFVLLLINALAFNNLYKKKQEFIEQAALVKSQQENYAVRKSSLEQKETLVKSILSNSGSKSSFYLNRIVATIPGHIQLSEFSFQPVVGSIRADKEIKVLQDLIQIEGTTNNPKQFGQWISDLETLDFIEYTQVDGFSDESRTSTFSLTLKLKEE